MKRLRYVGLILLSLVAGSAAAKAVPLNGALGANFNGEYQDVNFSDLSQAHAHWIRGFLPMTHVDPRHPGAQIAISTSLSAEKRGIHVILTLKWPFQKSGVPEPGSLTYARVVEQLDSVLPLVMGNVDIIEVGNEPYWETPPGERDQRLNDFYESMASRVIAYRNTHCHAPCTTHIFMGALNRLNMPLVRKTAWVQRWMSFVRETPEIEGVDIHPHANSLAASRPYIDYVLHRMRPDQKFLVTEFSLVWCWKAHMQDRVPSSFAQEYGVPAKAMIWQEIASAIKNPFPQQEWNDLLTRSSWFASQKMYLNNEVALFRATKRLAVATYGFEQGTSMTKEFGANSVPWLLNSVYARRTVRQGADGSAPTNPYWLAAFRKLIRP